MPLFKKQGSGKEKRGFGSKSNQAPFPKLNTWQSDIIEKIRFLQTKLGRGPFSEFRFDPEKFEYYFDAISYEAHKPGAVSSMVTDILKHFGMPPEHMNVRVEYIPENAACQEIGTYSRNDSLRGTVVIRIKPSYMYDTVISIAAHECTHHYLFHHNIKLAQTNENERLTDIAVIYIGCGFYYSFGAHLGTTVSQDWNALGQQVTTTTRHRLGYLKDEEFDFAYSEIRRIRGAKEKETAEKMQRYRQQAVQLMAEYQIHIRKNNEMIASARNQTHLRRRTERTACPHFFQQADDGTRPGGRVASKPSVERGACRRRYCRSQKD